MLFAGWTVVWSSPGHVVLNIAATLLWIAAMVDLFGTPRERWHNPRGRVLQIIVVIFFAAYYRGVFIPLGPAIWFAFRRRGWLGLSAST